MEAVLRRRGRHGVPRVARRGRAAALLGRTQGGVPGHGRALTGLLLHGRLHSAQAARGGAAGNPAAWSAKYGLRCTNVFHAGDGNLHPLILFDANIADEVARAEAFGGEILELCVREGGSITGEHGVGMEKINQMCVQFGSGELETFHAVKRAFDARGLLNPGKAVPTLHRCAEFGRLHVHGGQLPHPELPRF